MTASASASTTNSTSTHTPSPCPSRPAIYHTSITSYATSLSPRKSRHRNLILHDRRIFQYRALLKFKTVKFSDVELDALRNSAPHVECEKDLRKKVQEVRWQCEKEIHEVKNQAKENEAELRKELDLRIGNERVARRDNEKLSEENATLKSDVVAWEKENDKIMDANEILVEELQISNEDNEKLKVSIEELSKEVSDLQRQVKNVAGFIKEAAEVSKKWNEVHAKQNEVFVKEREDMMENDAQRAVVLQQMQEEMQAKDEKIKWLEEADKNVVFKKMKDEMQVKDEKIKFLVESEQERLNQLKGMRRERDGLPECGCVTPKCTCKEGGYKADDDMMEWIHQNGGETNRESDSNYDAENSSDDWESEDYESEYESDEEDSEWEEFKAIRSLPAATAKLNDHKETWIEDAPVEEESNVKEFEERAELEEDKRFLPIDVAKLKAESVMPRKDAMANRENNVKEDKKDAGRTEELGMVTLQEIANCEAYLAKGKHNSSKGIVEGSLLTEARQKARNCKEADLKLKRLQPDNDELNADIETSLEYIPEEERSSIIDDRVQLLLVEAYKGLKPDETSEAPGKWRETLSDNVAQTKVTPMEFGLQDVTAVLQAEIKASYEDALPTEENSSKHIKEPIFSTQTGQESKTRKPLSTPANLSNMTIKSSYEGLDWGCLTPTIICAPTPAPSVSSSEAKAATGLLWEEELNEARDASRNWWLEVLARAGEQSHEAEEKRLANEAKEHKPADDKKKKKKNKSKKKGPPDPNAPKKPLAPFIFYMQTARLIIASDLGGLSPQDPLVDTEGQNRWNEMAEGDKKLWISAYTDNLALYNARVHAYKNGFASAGGWSDLQAIQHAERNNVEPLPGGQLFLVNELTPAERKMVKVRMKEQEMEFRERAEWDRRGRDRRAPDGTWIEIGSRWAD